MNSVPQVALQLFEFEPFNQTPHFGSALVRRATQYPHHHYLVGILEKKQKMVCKSAKLFYRFNLHVRNCFAIFLESYQTRLTIFQPYSASAALQRKQMPCSFFLVYKNVYVQSKLLFLLSNSLNLLQFYHLLKNARNKNINHLIKSKNSILFQSLFRESLSLVFFVSLFVSLFCESPS